VWAFGLTLGFDLAGDGPTRGPWAAMKIGFGWQRLILGFRAWRRLERDEDWRTGSRVREAV